MLPSIHGQPNKEKDTTNFSFVLLAPIECRLKLGELLKIRPHLWVDLVGTLQKMGIKGFFPKHIENLKEENQTPTSVQLVPLNKVGEYWEGAHGNMTLPTM